VQTAYDGESALAHAIAGWPEVVLLDIGLPDADGYEICRRIRAHPGGQAMTLIALTGWGDQEAKRKSQSAGFDGHLVKPVDEDALLAAIAMARAARPGPAEGS
jgi:CheY-like chemotaxis protein